MKNTITLPLGAQVSLQYIGRPGTGRPLGGAIIILPEGADSIDEAMRGKPNVHAAVTHDAGTDWPDAFGCGGVQAALDQGGFAVLEFESAADARNCRHRLEGRAHV